GLRRPRPARRRRVGDAGAGRAESEPDDRRPRGPVLRRDSRREARMTTECVVPFRARDGFEANLLNVRGADRPEKGPVLLVHGAGVRANIFRAPSGGNVVDSLVAAGYDVWLENWRASIDFAPNRWTLDQAAVHDHPAAVETVVRETGAPELKAIIHCQGS